MLLRQHNDFDKTFFIFSSPIFIISNHLHIAVFAPFLTTHFPNQAAANDSWSPHARKICHFHKFSQFLSSRSYKICRLQRHVRPSQPDPFEWFGFGTGFGTGREWGEIFSTLFKNHPKMSHLNFGILQQFLSGNSVWPIASIFKTCQIDYFRHF